MNIDLALLHYVSNAIWHENDAPEVGARLHNYGCPRHQATLNYLFRQGYIRPTGKSVGPMMPRKNPGFSLVFYPIYQPTEQALELYVKEKQEHDW